MLLIGRDISGKRFRYPPPVAGTAHPAMGMRADADNAVLLPEFVDSSLRFKSVRYVHVEAADQTASAYTFLTVGTADMFAGDQIQWQENLGPEIRRRSYIGLGDGHWVLRDGLGAFQIISWLASFIADLTCDWTIRLTLFSLVHRDASTAVIFTVPMRPSSGEFRARGFGSLAIPRRVWRS